MSRASAHAALDVPSEASAEVARSAFLRSLAGDRFVPTEDCVVAVNRIAGSDLPFTFAAEATASAMFREEIDGFKRTFWSLPPAERRVRWNELRMRCREDGSAASIRRLEEGLDIPNAADPNPKAEQLAVLIRRLFLLPPRERTKQRTDWLLAQAKRFREWRAISQLLHRDSEPLVGLEPRLFEWFEDWRGLRPVYLPDEDLRREPRERLHIASDSDQAVFSESVDGEYWEKRDAKNARNIVKTGFMFGVGSIVFVMLMAVANRFLPDKPRAQPTVSRPVDTAPHAKQKFAPEEIKAFERYEQTSTTGVPPSGYWEFVDQFGHPIVPLSRQESSKAQPVWNRNPPMRTEE